MATIELLFQDISDGGSVQVERISFDGTFSLMPKTQQESIISGGN